MEDNLAGQLLEGFTDPDVYLPKLKEWKNLYDSNSEVFAEKIREARYSDDEEASNESFLAFCNSVSELCGPGLELFSKYGSTIETPRAALEYFPAVYGLLEIDPEQVLTNPIFGKMLLVLRECKHGGRALFTGL